MAGRVGQIHQPLRLLVWPWFELGPSPPSWRHTMLMGRHATTSRRRAHYLSAYGRERAAETLVRTAVGARFMVRMGSPISCQGAAHHQARWPVSVQVCHFHADESVPGRKLGDGSVSYTCPRSRGHPEPGPYTWLDVPRPPGLPELTGIAAELGLDTELPRVLAEFP
jgi:hypothetical protein